MTRIHKRLFPFHCFSWPRRHHMVSRQVRVAVHNASPFGREPSRGSLNTMARLPLETRVDDIGNGALLGNDQEWDGTNEKSLQGQRLSGYAHECLRRRVFTLSKMLVSRCVMRPCNIARDSKPPLLGYKNHLNVMAHLSLDIQKHGRRNTRAANPLISMAAKADTVETV